MPLTISDHVRRAREYRSAAREALLVGQTDDALYQLARLEVLLDGLLSMVEVEDTDERERREAAEALAGDHSASRRVEVLEQEAAHLIADAILDADTERLLDARIQRRLRTDAAYRNAADGEEQAEREEQIVREEEDRLARERREKSIRA